jgi:LPS-assembly protein
VNIPAGTSGRGNSNLVGEIYGFLAPGWYLRSGLEWDGEQGRSARTSAYLHYRPTADRVINLGYRYVQSLQEQVDLSAHWPLAGRWNGLARWVYSLPEENTLQAYGGIEYRSCCWALRAIARRAVLADGRTDKSVVLAFELTGLGSLGKVAENPLQLSRFMFE